MVDRKQLVGIKCDLCGLEASGLSWGSAIYEMAETEVSVTVKQRQGTDYPEGGQGTEYNIDLCPTCFKDRLVVWLRSEGADIKETEWDNEI